jgi:hypothetical protein
MRLTVLWNLLSVCVSEFRLLHDILYSSVPNELNQTQSLRAGTEVLEFIGDQSADLTDRISIIFLSLNNTTKMSAVLFYILL